METSSLLQDASNSSLVRLTWSKDFLANENSETPNDEYGSSPWKKSKGAESMPVKASESLDSPISSDAIPRDEDCVAHLSLLFAFVVLKSRVHGCASLSGVEKDVCWQSYVSFAVTRFSLWVRSLDRNMTDLLPPLGESNSLSSFVRSMLMEVDVLLVWHAFMLNPKEYQMFCKVSMISVETRERLRRGLCWKQIAACINPVNGSFDASVRQLQDWKARKLHPDLLSWHQEMSLPPSDLKSHRTLEEASSQLHRQSSLVAETEVAREASKHLIKTWNSMAASEFRVKNIDFDLVAAIERQMRFSMKMAQVGWLHSPARLSIVENAVKRYLQFFALMKEMRGMVPTLDIDLVWHTHQLCPEQYLGYCLKEKGGLIDHDDKVEDSVLVDGFDQTQKLYKSRFGQEYAICHSWTCTLAALEGQNAKTGHDPESIVALIAAENHRRTQDGVSVLVDRGHLSDDCHGEHEENCNTKCNSNCGKDCTGNCHQGCSSDCCGTCESSCSSTCASF